MEFISNFFTDIWGFFEVIPEMIDNAMQVFGAYLVIQYVKFQVWSLGFAWGVAKEVLEQINLSGTINELWGGLDSTLLGYLTFFKIPEALSMIINARVTRYVLDLMRS